MYTYKKGAVNNLEKIYYSLSSNNAFKVIDYKEHYYLPGENISFHHVVELKVERCYKDSYFSDYPCLTDVLFNGISSYAVEHSQDDGTGDVAIRICFEEEIEGEDFLKKRNVEILETYKRRVIVTIIQRK